METTHATILRVVLYPANGDKIEIPGDQVAGVAGGAEGNTVVVQQLPDGTVRRWIGLPAMMEHAPPSSILMPPPRRYGS